MVRFQFVHTLYAYKLYLNGLSDVGVPHQNLTRSSGRR